MSTPRFRLPETAAAGEVIEVRTLIDHEMITAVSSSAPRDMLSRFEATMNGETVISVDYANGSAANPTLTFFVRVAAPGEFAFTWTHEDGTTFTAEGRVEVG